VLAVLTESTAVGDPTPAGFKPTRICQQHASRPSLGHPLSNHSFLYDIIWRHTTPKAASSAGHDVLIIDSSDDDADANSDDAIYIVEAANVAPAQSQPLAALPVHPLPQLKLARCAFSDRILHSRMPLDPTHVRLKLLHACDRWHSSRESTALTVAIINDAETLKAPAPATSKYYTTKGKGPASATLSHRRPPPFSHTTTTASAAAPEVTERELTDAFNQMYGARFPTEIYTRGCHWFPRMFA
jgi:hypothetical protein